MDPQQFLQEIDTCKEEIFNISDSIWDFAELQFEETRSAELLCAHLEAHGFTVERGVGGMKTAFTATYGSTAPAIGILAEYDALSGLSQKANSVVPEVVPEMTSGHGCGHNLFAAGSFAAALAVKKGIELSGKGKVTVFGCPAEEGGGGKVKMAQSGVFSQTDAVVSWHPESMHMVRTRPALANIDCLYSFHGISAHAGASPHLGRSALDALELMNIGIQFLREHMEPTSRINTSITNAGSAAPNVIPDFAQGRFLIRAETPAQVRDLAARIDRIAQGAALMTDTTVEYKFLKGYNSLVTIPALQQAVYESMVQIPVPQPTAEDVAFGEALRATMPLSDEQRKKPLYPTEVIPPAPPKPHGGSTDTADVSWVCPTVQVHGGSWVIGTPGHSWQVVSQGKSRFSKESMLYTAKVLALTAVRLINDPELLEQAKAEHRER
ncbi:MAG: amidohydrolase, partial [Lentisphaeria bacterium]|nr:amidohydrolase [Lentisphaeria bacterium]